MFTDDNKKTLRLPIVIHSWVAKAVDVMMKIWIGQYSPLITS